MTPLCTDLRRKALAKRPNLASTVYSLYHTLLVSIRIKGTVRGCAKKSGLASEALTRVQEQLEQSVQFLQISYNNCIILVYSSFFYLENWRRCAPKCKKMDPDKMNRLSIFMCEDGISFKPKKHFPKIRLTETYNIPNWWKFYDDSNGVIRFEILPL